MQKILLILSIIGAGFIGTHAQTVSFTTTIQPSSCSANGQICVHANQGILPYRYELDSIGGSIHLRQDDSCFTALPRGTYRVRVIDALGRITQQAVNVQGNYVLPTLTASYSGSCATVTVTNGRKPYRFYYTLESSGQRVAMNATPSDSATLTTCCLASGTYIFDVEDSCRNLYPYRMTMPYVSSPSFNINQIAHTDSIDIVLDRLYYGEPPYTYECTGDDRGIRTNSTGNFYGLKGCNFVVKVTDKCGRTSQRDVTANTSPSLSIICSNSDAGTATVTATGGKRPYIFQETRSNTSNSTGIFTGLPVGQDYTFKVIDSCGKSSSSYISPFRVENSWTACPFTGDVRISSYQSSDWTYKSFPPITYTCLSCNPVITRIDSTSTWISGVTFPNLPAGTHRFQVTNNCGATKEMTVTMAPSFVDVYASAYRYCYDNSISVWSNGDFFILKDRFGTPIDSNATGSFNYARNDTLRMQIRRNTCGNASREIVIPPNTVSLSATMNCDSKTITASGDRNTTFILKTKLGAFVDSNRTGIFQFTNLDTFLVQAIHPSCSGRQITVYPPLHSDTARIRICPYGNVQANGRYNWELFAAYSSNSSQYHSFRLKGGPNNINVLSGSGNYSAYFYNLPAGTYTLEYDCYPQTVIIPDIAAPTLRLSTDLSCPQSGVVIASGGRNSQDWQALEREHHIDICSVDDYYILYDAAGNYITSNYTGRFDENLLSTTLYRVSLRSAGYTVATDTIRTRSYVRSRTIATFGSLCQGVTNGDITITVNGGIKPFTYEILRPAGTRPAIVSDSNVAIFRGLPYGTYDVRVYDKCRISADFTGSIAPVTVNTNYQRKCKGDLVLTATDFVGGIYRWTNARGDSIGNTAELTLHNTSSDTQSYKVSVQLGRCAFLGEVNVHRIIRTPPSNAGLDFESRLNTATLNGSATPDWSTPTWIPLNSNPSSTNFSSPFAPTTGITVGNVEGLYRYIWSVDGNTGSCINEDTVNVRFINCAIVPNLTATIDSVQPKMCVNDGRITLRVNNVQRLPLYVRWSTGDTSLTINGLGAGRYTVGIKDSSICHDTLWRTVQLVTPARLTGLIQKNDAFCYNKPNGNAIARISGGTLPYRYRWSNGLLTQNISSLLAGTYQLTVTDAQNCDTTLSVTILQPNLIRHTRRDTICQGDSLRVGTSVYKISGTYIDTLRTNIGCDSVVTTLLLVPPVYLIRLDSVVCAGTRVQIGNQFYDTTNLTQTRLRSQYGCDSVVTLGLTVIPHLTVTANVRPSIYCGATGQITLNLSRRTIPYSIRWSTGDTSLIINNLRQGFYSVTITDSSVCNDVIVRTIEITAPPRMTGFIEKSDAFCYNKPNGNAMARISGGTLPYQYRWSNGALTQSVSNLLAGTYQLTVTDAQNCDTILSITINQPNLIRHTRRDTICQGDSLRVGTSVYKISGTYIDTLRTNIGCDSVVTTELFVPPVYAIRVDSTICAGSRVQIGTQFYDSTSVFQTRLKSQYGCDSIVTLGLTVIPHLTVTANVRPSIYCGATGQISLNLSRRTIPYNIRWSTGDNSLIISNLRQGFYGVTITDSSVCNDVIVQNIEITAPPRMTGFIEKNDAFCYNKPNGNAMAQISGGTLPYQYRWSNGALTQSVSNLLAGTYQLTVTDAQNCDTILSITINQPNLIRHTRHDTICNGDSLQVGRSTYKINGIFIDTFQTNIGCDSVVTTHLHVLPIYSIRVDSTVCVGTRARIGNIFYDSTGIYPTMLRTKAGCDSLVTLHLTVVPNLELTFSTQNTTSCTNMGTAHVSMNRAYGNNILWSNGARSHTIRDLAVGFYSVTVTDSSVCRNVVTGRIEITAPPRMTGSIQKTDVLCYGDSTGSATAQMSNGVAPYRYRWWNGQNVPTIGSLPAGTYRVTVTDDQNCDTILSVMINQPNLIRHTRHDTICQGDSLRVGRSIYKINGIYIDTLQTIIGCDSIVTTHLLVRPIYAIQVDSTICEDSRVQIGNQFYDRTGIFTTLLRTQHGCDSLVTLNLTVVPRLALTLTSVRTTSCTNIGSATVTLSRTNEPYQLRWSTGEQTNTIRNLAAGSYSVTVSDASVCNQQLIRSIVVTAPLPLSGSIRKEDATCFQKPYGNATVLALNGTPPYTYQWSNNLISSSITDLYAGSYSVTITDSDGCKYYVSTVIQEPEILKKVRYDTICNGNRIQIGNHEYTRSGIYIDTLRPIIGCDTMVTTHLWVRDTFIVHLKQRICYGDSVRIGDTAFSTTGVFTRYLQSQLYCDSIVTLDLTVFPKINIAAQIKTACAEDSIGAIITQLSGGKPPYQCVWQPTGATTPSLEHLPAGNYTMRLKDGNNCVINKMFVVPQYLKPDYSIKGKMACEGHTSGSIRFRSAARDLLQWSFNRNSYVKDSIINGLLPRSYPIWVKDTQNCVYKQTIELQPATPIRVQLPNNTVLKLGDSLKIIPNIQSIDAVRSWRWEPGLFLNCANCPEPVSTPTQRVDYRLVVENVEGCRAEARILIDVDKDQKTYVPNVFSPNGDGNNDFFTIFGRNIESIESLQLFNRWGNRVFEAKNFEPNQPELGWNGMFDGVAMPPDVFVYFAVIRWKGGEKTTLKGDVTLTR